MHNSNTNFMHKKNLKKSFDECNDVKLDVFVKKCFDEWNDVKLDVFVKNVLTSEMMWN